MANKQVNGKITKQGRDLLKDSYSKEELMRWEKTLARINNSSLTREEFECYYEPSFKFKKRMEFISKNPQISTEEIMFGVISDSVILSLGALYEEMLQKDVDPNKLAKMIYNSNFMNRIHDVIFNANKTSNIAINGVNRYIWMEEIGKVEYISLSDVDEMEKVCDIVADIRALRDYAKTNLPNLVASIEGNLYIFELMLKLFFDVRINSLKESLNQPGFIKKFWNSVLEYKGWILGYAAVAAVVYFGIAVAAIPVAGEVFTVANAAAATAVETASFATSVGVVGAILL